MSWITSPDHTWLVIAFFTMSAARFAAWLRDDGDDK